MKIISWNVNGIRSVLSKGFLEWFKSTDTDVLCLQETKICERDLDEHVPSIAGYGSYWHFAERAGYSGVAVFTKQPPLSIERGLILSPCEREGRVITLEFERLFIVNVYVPNTQTGYARLPVRLAWDKALHAHLAKLKQKKSVIVCGDFNVAHSAELDIGIQDARGFPGCSQEERDSFSELLSLGYMDTFRVLNPAKRAYSWWAYTNDARSWNQGLRFDYILASEDLRDSLQSASTERDTPGSDHGPVSLELSLPFGESCTAQNTVKPSGQFGFGI